MIDSQPTQPPALDSTTLDEKERERTNRADALLPVNKTALFDALASACITTVVVTFDGRGDIGQIENVETKSSEELVNLPPGFIEIARAMRGMPEIERQSLSLHDAIEALIYDLLGQIHNGWENGEGAYGTFTFEVADRTITLDYDERRIESDYSQHVF